MKGLVGTSVYTVTFVNSLTGVQNQILDGVWWISSTAFKRWGLLIELSVSSLLQQRRTDPKSPFHIRIVSAPADNWYATVSRTVALVNRTRDVTMNYSYGKIKTLRPILSVKADAKRWNRGPSFISGDNLVIAIRICSDIHYYSYSKFWGPR